MAYAEKICLANAFIWFGGFVLLFSKVESYSDIKLFNAWVCFALFLFSLMAAFQ